jgi:hypothetical protein
MNQIVLNQKQKYLKYKKHSNDHKLLGGRFPREALLHLFLCGVWMIAIFAALDISIPKP